MSNAPASENAPYVSKNLFMAFIPLRPENGLKASRSRALTSGLGSGYAMRVCEHAAMSKRCASVFAVDQFFIGVNIVSCRRLYGIDGARSKPRRRVILQ